LFMGECNLIRISAAGKEVKYCEVRNSQSFDETGDQFDIVTLNDVTARVKAMQTVKTQDDRWKLALEGSEIGVFESDLRSGSGSASASWYQLLGLTSGMERDSDQEWHARVHPDDLGSVVANDARCIDGLTDRAESTFRMRVRDDSWHWMRSVLKVTERDEDGTAIRLLGTMTDITEQKQLDELKDNFVATVSHELRTPLAALYGALGLLGASIGDDASSQTRKLLGMSHRNSTRLIAMIDELLDFQKLNGGHFSIKIDQLEVVGLIRKVCADFEAFAQTFGVSFDVNTAEEKIFIDADPLRLKQVITNLLSNATKFSMQSGVVSVMLERDDETCRISVTDNGCGISPEFTKRVFTPFSQQTEVSPRSTKGTGLGLAICKGLMDMMNGEIGFESEPDVKTTFWVTLPLSTVNEINQADHNL
ncbi:ATP-binding protein, partial [Loktanella sp. DJP18]|uniref:sensor histidine kinase n=1 Tax=Loktanella sp. DJP18 TaxID=3409788 RepID=UPI003BB6DB51